jgi:hypothetical protein
LQNFHFRRFFCSNFAETKNLPWGYSTWEKNVKRCFCDYGTKKCWNIKIPKNLPAGKTSFPVISLQWKLVFRPAPLFDQVMSGQTWPHKVILMKKQYFAVWEVKKKAKSLKHNCLWSIYRLDAVISSRYYVLKAIFDSLLFFVQVLQVAQHRYVENISLFFQNSQNLLFWQTKSWKLKKFNIHRIA